MDSVWLPWAATMAPLSRWHWPRWMKSSQDRRTPQQKWAMSTAELAKCFCRHTRSMNCKLCNWIWAGVWTCACTKIWNYNCLTFLHYIRIIIRPLYIWIYHGERVIMIFFQRRSPPYKRLQLQGVFFPNSNLCKFCLLFGMTSSAHHHFSLDDSSMIPIFSFYHWITICYQLTINNQQPHSHLHKQSWWGH